MAFKERFRSVDVLMIDDVQFINGGIDTEEFSPAMTWDDVPSCRIRRQVSVGS